MCWMQKIKQIKNLRNRDVVMVRHCGGGGGPGDPKMDYVIFECSLMRPKIFNTSKLPSISYLTLSLMAMVM